MSAGSGFPHLGARLMSGDTRFVRSILLAFAVGAFGLSSTDAQVHSHLSSPVTPSLPVDP